MARMDLDHLVLSHGVGALREVQRAFNLTTELTAADLPAAEWFISFASSLDGPWLREVSLSVVERFFRELKDSRMRRASVELIAKVEAVDDPAAQGASGSLLVTLFRQAQPEPFLMPLSEAGSLIVLTLLARAKLTADSVWQSPQGSLANRALRVVRYCFRDEYQKLTPTEMDSVVSLAGEVSDELRQRIYQRLL